MCHVVASSFVERYVSFTEPIDFTKLNLTVKNYIDSMIIHLDFSMFCAVKAWDHS